MPMSRFRTPWVLYQGFQTPIASPLLSPLQRIRYPVVKQTRRARSRDVESARTPAPSYEVHPRGSNIAPPDYQDALNDAVVNTEESMVQVCVYSKYVA